MTSGLSRFRVGRNRQMLGVAALLAAAVLDLPWPGGSAASELMVVLDITQSMAVTDRSIDTPEGGRRTVSRLAFAQDRLGALLARLPCGTRVGWGVFSAHRSFVLMAPAEVCANFQELGRTLVHIDSKMAWAGNSEIAKGLDSALLTVKDLAAGTRLVFVTDGQEAPPLNAAHRPGFHTEPGDVPGLILGVGGDEPAPIPRLDPQGRRVGTWRATDVPQVDPRSADAATGVLPRPVVGATPGREHLSALREDYLRLLA